MPVLRTRASKGSELSHAELDANFKRTVSAKTTTYACLVSDNRSVIECNHATTAFTVTLGDAATMAAAETGDYEVTIANIGAATVTVARAGSDTIDGGATSITLPQYSSVTLVVNSAGNGYNTIANGADVARVGQANTFSGVNTYSATQKWAKGADVASGTALTLGTDGNYFDITGTTTITSIGTLGAGTVVKLHFDGALTLTHHATDLILPGGANITTVAGDEAEFIEYASGDWRCTNYTGLATTTARGVVELATASEAQSGTDTEKVVTPSTLRDALVSETAQATTSGTAFDFTSLPSWIKRITVIFNSVSLSGTDNIVVQLGDSGGIEATGYTSVYGEHASSGGIVATATDGFYCRLATAARSLTGHMVITNISGDLWVASSSYTNGLDATGESSGAKTLSGTLDRLRVTRSGTDTFDNGSVNIFYE